MTEHANADRSVETGRRDAIYLPSEIEVTPEMIAAGVAVLLRELSGAPELPPGFDVEVLAKSVFLEMRLGGLLG